MIHILAIHVRPFEEAAVQQVDRLIVGMAIHQVVDQPDRPGGEGMQRGDEIHQLIRSQGLQQGGVGGRSGEDHHVVAPVLQIGATQLHPHGSGFTDDAFGLLIQDVFIVVPQAEEAILMGPASPVFHGGFGRQQLHGVVAEEVRFRRGEVLPTAELAPQLPEQGRQPREVAIRRSRFDMQLQDVPRRGHHNRSIAIWSAK